MSISNAVQAPSIHCQPYRHPLAMLGDLSRAMREPAGKKSGAKPGGKAGGSVCVEWTPDALQGLRAMGMDAWIETLVVHWVTSWAERGAHEWTLDTPRRYVSHAPRYTAMARLVAIDDGMRRVSITRFA